MTPRFVTRHVSLIVVFCWVVGCGASARQKTIATTLTATKAADAALVAYDARHQQDLIAAAPDRVSALADIAAYRTKRDEVVKVLVAVYQAIAAAATVNDDPSITSMLAAAAQLNEALVTLGVLK